MENDHDDDFLDNILSETIDELNIQSVATTFTRANMDTVDMLHNPNYQHDADFIHEAKLEPTIQSGEVWTEEQYALEEVKVCSNFIY
jgi:hypothetical protein